MKTALKEVSQGKKFTLAGIDWIVLDQKEDAAFVLAADELEEIKKTLKNKLFYLLAAIPECSEGRSIQAYVEQL